MKPQTNAYFQGGPWAGKYKWVDDTLHLVKVPEPRGPVHVYKETFHKAERIFLYSGTTK